MAVLATPSTQKVACLTWHTDDKESTVQVESCGRSYWSFLQRARAIDSKQLGNVSALRVDSGPEEEVRPTLRSNGHPCAVRYVRTDDS